jgi:hypothetical protein
MVTGSLALAAAAAFTGASFYVNFVEQPARLRLDDAALLEEWRDSDHRGFGVLAGLALLSALFGFIDFKGSNDFRPLVGTATIIAAWPFMFFAIVPLNNRILALIAAEAGPEARKTIELWGRLELGLTALGALATGVFVVATA